MRLAESFLLSENHLVGLLHWVHLHHLVLGVGFRLIEQVQILLAEDESVGSLLDVVFIFSYSSSLPLLGCSQNIKFVLEFSSLYLVKALFVVLILKLENYSLPFLEKASSLRH